MLPEGGAFALECVLDAVPAAQLVWYRDSNALPLAPQTADAEYARSPELLICSCRLLMLLSERIAIDADADALMLSFFVLRHRRPGRFAVRNASLSHSGVYACAAANLLGSDRATVKVSGAPVNRELLASN